MSDKQMPDAVAIEECPEAIYLDSVGTGTWADKEDGKWRLKYIRSDLCAPSDEIEGLAFALHYCSHPKRLEIIPEMIPVIEAARRYNQRVK